MTVVIPSETYAIGSGDRLGPHPVCRIIVSVWFIHATSPFVSRLGVVRLALMQGS
jgi:hypothetical protein